MHLLPYYVTIRGKQSDCHPPAKQTKLTASHKLQGHQLQRHQAIGLPRMSSTSATNRADCEPPAPMPPAPRPPRNRTAMTASHRRSLVEVDMMTARPNLLPQLRAVVRPATDCIQDCRGVGLRFLPLRSKSTQISNNHQHLIPKVFWRKSC